MKDEAQKNTKSKGVTNYMLFGVILLVLALIVIAFFYFIGTNIIRDTLTKMLVNK